MTEAEGKNALKPVIEASWYEALKKEFESEYFLKLKEFLVLEKKHHIVYPQGQNIFNAFNLTPITKVKVVILGQDPYHGPGQAHGLCFSVPDGIPAPPSLQNIFKELHQDIGIPVPRSNNLTSWALQGVFLLNATLTVRQHQAASHHGKGWELFTDAAIRSISQNCSNVVFLLWGRHAREKKVLIDQAKHLVLEAAHPSPLSAYNGFFGCKHFSTTNNYLISKGLSAINWELPK